MANQRLVILGANIKAARVKKHLSQEKLAELTGISLSSASLIETGKQNTATLNLIDLARVLEISLDELTRDV